ALVAEVAQELDLSLWLPRCAAEGPDGERMAEVIIKTLQDFKITSQSIGYFVLNKAPNNDSTVTILAQDYGFNATHRRLRCGPHTLNLIGQTLLWGKGSAALFDNDVQELTDEHDFIEEWRRVGLLGVLLSIMNYIKTPQQHKLFEDFQRLAHTELPSSASADDRKILEPVKPVVTRWNSYYSCFERAVKLQFAVNADATHHIQRVQREDTFAQSRGNKLPVAQPWMRSDGLTGADWAVITEYMDILKPLKTATKRLEGRGKSGSFGAIAEIIPIFEYLLTYYEQRVNAYEAVNYNEHDESPEDHIVINLRAAWQKADDYYSKLDDSPAYYAATILHPMYKYYCDKAWARKPDWLEASNASFQALWAQYNTSPRVVRPSAVIPSDIDDAIDSILNPSTASSLTDDEDEFKRWKRSVPAAKRGTEYADFIQSLSSVAQLPAPNHKKSQTFVPENTALNRKLGLLKDGIDLGDYAIPINNLLEPGMAQSALKILDQFVVEKMGTNLGFLYQNLVERCVSGVQAQYEEQKAKACKPQAEYKTPIAPEASASDVQERKQKEKSRSTKPSIYEITPQATTDDEPTQSKDMFKVKASTVEVFSSLFSRSSAARSPVRWEAFVAAMTDLGFSIDPKVGSIYTFVPPEK
ncbi:hypothetical protein Alg130_11478, partial [Pyrenophora tritici-repentis]